jgi:hypothetical protein
VHYKLDISGGFDEERSVQRGITRDLRTGVAKSNDADGGIFEDLLRTATYLSFKN